ncbi:hypothetical protein ACWDBD_30480 [Streptomyces sp. NPDC001118]|uniref:hypothetical protein n=1 Tax=Streptomyces sp. CG4 TaxID=408783 RepID=UPI0034E1E2FD
MSEAEVDMSEAEADAAVNRMQADTGVRMVTVVIEAMKLWTAGCADPADLRTIDDMARILISAIMMFTPDPNNGEPLPSLLTDLRAAALGSTM